MTIFLVLMTFIFMPNSVHAASEERIIGDEIKRSIVFQEKEMKIILSGLYKNLSMEKAEPLIILSAYEKCRHSGTPPFIYDQHFEPKNIEANFKCTGKGTLEDYKVKKVSNLCRDGQIRSYSQKVLCLEMGLES